MTLPLLIFTPTLKLLSMFDWALKTVFILITSDSFTLLINTLYMFIYSSTHTSLQMLHPVCKFADFRDLPGAQLRSLRHTHSFYHNHRVLTSCRSGFFTKASGTVLRIPIVPSKNPGCWMEILRVETFFLNINSKAKVHRTAVFWDDWGAEKMTSWIVLWQEGEHTLMATVRKQPTNVCGMKPVLKAEHHPWNK